MKILISELHDEFKEFESILDKIDLKKSDKAKNKILVDYELIWMSRLDENIILQDDIDLSDKNNIRKYKKLIIRMDYWEKDMPKYTYKAYKMFKKFLKYHGVIQ